MVHRLCAAYVPPGFVNPPQAIKPHHKLQDAGIPAGPEATDPGVTGPRATDPGVNSPKTTDQALVLNGTLVLSGFDFGPVSNRAWTPPSGTRDARKTL
jgi:hypothetical protein